MHRLSLTTLFKNPIRNTLRRIGFDWCRFTPSDHLLARKKRVIEYHNIDTVIDIGANSGQFAQQLRNDISYNGRIISFEPLRSAYILLLEKASKDPKWDVYNFALGDIEGKKVINIAENSLSSSLLSMRPLHLRVAPHSRYIAKELVNVKKLDSIFSNFYSPNDRIYLKIDTQGYEEKVLSGSLASLNFIDILQLELSLVSLYEGETLLIDMCANLSDKGFYLYGIDPVFTDNQTGQLLQVDCIFKSCRLKEA